MDRRDVLRAAWDALRATGAPGAAVAATTGSQTIEVAAGYADVAGAKEMRPDAVFRAGSMTKLYTATAVMQLVERGRIRLEHPVRAHLPQLAVENPLGPREVTVEDLLTFRSGLAVDTTGAGFAAQPSLAKRLEEAYSRGYLHEYHAGLPLWTAEVGSRYQYSNLGIATLGLLVEAASGDGTSFDEYVSEHILQPLGMHSSALVGGSTGAPPTVLRDRMATGYVKFGRTLVPTPELACADYPANGLITTVGDHLKLLTMLARGGADGDRRILRRESVEAMLRPRMPIGDLRIAPDGTWWVGLSVMLANVDAPDFHFGHPGGYMWGWWSISRAYPRRDLAYVVAVNAWDMTNWHDPSNPDAGSLIAATLASGSAPGTQPWGWKRAYVAGLLLAERTCGFLGVAPDDRALQHLLAAAGPVAGSDDWDEYGFRAGVQDFLAADRRLRVDPHELGALFVSLGGAPSLPLPLMFWPAAPPQEHPEAPADGRPEGRFASRS